MVVVMEIWSIPYHLFLIRVKLLLTNFNCIVIFVLRRSGENILTCSAHPFILVLYTIDHYMALTLLLAQILDCVTSYDKMEERKRRKKGRLVWFENLEWSHFWSDIFPNQGWIINYQKMDHNLYINLPTLIGCIDLQ